MAIERDSARTSSAVGLQRFAEERLRSGDAAVRSQQEIDRATLLVDRAIQIAGSHLVTARAGYTHHGIYVGNGMVVQYSGLTSGARGGSVEEIPLQRFARGRPFWINSGRRPSFDAPEIVQRARARVGEHRYDLLTNNCEHFCEWCLHGQQRSYQVERLLGRNRYVQQIASRTRVSKMAETLLMATLHGNELTLRLAGQNIAGKKYFSSTGANIVAQGPPRLVKFSISTRF